MRGVASGSGPRKGVLVGSLVLLWLGAAALLVQHQLLSAFYDPRVYVPPVGDFLLRLPPVTFPVAAGIVSIVLLGKERLIRKPRWALAAGVVGLAGIVVGGYFLLYHLMIADDFLVIFRSAR